MQLFQGVLRKLGFLFKITKIKSFAFVELFNFHVKLMQQFISQCGMIVNKMKSMLVAAIYLRIFAFPVFKNLCFSSTIQIYLMKVYVLNIYTKLTFNHHM